MLMDDSSNHFDQWNRLKQTLDAEDGFPPYWKEREIWWASIGKNIGHEEDGKNIKFNRPVLVIKKFNHRLLWGVPLTTKIKNDRHYHKFIFRDREQCAMLTQMRLMDASRLTEKMGKIGNKEFKNIKFNLSIHLQ